MKNFKGYIKNVKIVAAAMAIAVSILSLTACGGNGQAEKQQEADSQITEENVQYEKTMTVDDTSSDTSFSDSTEID
ncbi:hypothetical protein [Agathobacter sp.]